MIVAATGSVFVTMVVTGAGITVGMVVAMVMRAAFAVFVLVSGFGSVVMRAAFAVFMLVTGFGSVVVRAALAVFVLVTGFGGVVVRAAGAVLVVVFSRNLCGVDGRVRQGGNKA